jgi:TRAP-type uncharacterized transport system substrate-binding protein
MLVPSLLHICAPCICYIKQVSDFEGFAIALGLPQDSTEWLMSAITRHASTEHNMYICENIVASQQQQQQQSTDADIDDSTIDKPVKKASIDTVSLTDYYRYASYLYVARLSSKSLRKCMLT